MKKSDLLFEIGTEEIPSGYFNRVMDLLSGDNKNTLLEVFSKNKIEIEPEKVSSYCTPRRIILFIKDIPLHQDMIIEGPPKKIAFDDSNKPTKALVSFLEKNSASINQIEVVQDKKIERVRLFKKNVSNKDILEQILPKIIKLLTFPKTMHWDDEKVLFARPLRNLLALFGKDALNFSFGSVVSSNTTFGHRFFGKQSFVVKDAASYFNQLDKNGILWDHNKRREKILKYLSEKGWVENDSLLDEVNNLVEMPAFIEGEFNREYLSLPNEVLMASMSKHQRVFCIKDKKGALCNSFVAVVNGNYKNLNIIKKNLENVLDARLKDAFYFYKTDIKKPLEKWADGLSSVVFHKQLGTIKDKIGRLKNVAEYLKRSIPLDTEEEDAVNRAIVLAKADLLTQMVGEFPSLQGIMGSYYALESSEKEIVATTIREHYLPRFSGDVLPKTKSGTVASLSDKLDNIICYFKIGKFPKASWDLYALRRQGIGIISILIEQKISLLLGAAFDFLYSNAPGDYEETELKSIYMDFFKERFVALIKEKNDYRYDLVESVVSGGVDDIYNSFLKLELLNSIIDKPFFEKARCIVERTNNIIRGFKDEASELNQELLTEPEEKALDAAYKDVKEEFMRLVNAKDYVKATELFGEKLFDIIHVFFDKVLVNVEDSKLRDNRKVLLMSINRLYTEAIADLSKIVVTENR
ncbi:MAG: glycine--tRNA ligase subunit beta [Candidatus Omnitrophota bacterium]